MPGAWGAQTVQGVEFIVFIVNPRKLEHGFRMISARFPLLYLQGMGIMMFQLSGFYSPNPKPLNPKTLNPKP